MIEVQLVGAEAAADVHAVVLAAFSARPPLDPPAAALSETVESVAAELAERGGLVARLDGQVVAALILEPVGSALGLRRFGVLPEHQGHGLAHDLVEAAVELARARGYAGLRVQARHELPATIRFWQHSGFALTSHGQHLVELVRQFPVTGVLHDADAACDLGARLGKLLRAGDLLVLSGDLGAGKTTFTRGIGAGLQVRGDITSPTFVIARVHPSLVGGPALVHVDAYRLGGFQELDDLDLDTSLDDAVTVVEWGEGVAEGLADERLEVRILRAVGDSIAEDHDPREVLLQPVGFRWLGALDGLV